MDISNNCGAGCRQVEAGQWAGEPGEAGRVEQSWKNLQLATTMVDEDRREVNCASEAIITGAAMLSAFVDNGS